MTTIIPRKPPPSLITTAMLFILVSLFTSGVRAQSLQQPLEAKYFVFVNGQLHWLPLNITNSPSNSPFVGDCTISLCNNTNFIDGSFARSPRGLIFGDNGNLLILDTEKHFFFTFSPETKQIVNIQKNSDLPGFNSPPYRFLGPLAKLNSTHAYATTVFGDIIQIVNTDTNPYKLVLPGGPHRIATLLTVDNESSLIYFYDAAKNAIFTFNAMSASVDSVTLFLSISSTMEVGAMVYCPYEHGTGLRYLFVAQNPRSSSASGVVSKIYIIATVNETAPTATEILRLNITGRAYGLIYLHQDNCVCAVVFPGDLFCTATNNTNTNWTVYAVDKLDNRLRDILDQPPQRELDQFKYAAVVSNGTHVYWTTGLPLLLSTRITTISSRQSNNATLLAQGWNHVTGAVAYSYGSNTYEIIWAAEHYLWRTIWSLSPNFRSNFTELRATASRPITAIASASAATGVYATTRGRVLHYAVTAKTPTVLYRSPLENPTGMAVVHATGSPLLYVADPDMRSLLRIRVIGTNEQTPIPVLNNTEVVDVISWNDNTDTFLCILTNSPVDVGCRKLSADGNFAEDRWTMFGGFSELVGPRKLARSSVSNANLFYVSTEQGLWKCDLTPPRDIRLVRNSTAIYGLAFDASTLNLLFSEHSTVYTLEQAGYVSPTTHSNSYDSAITAVTLSQGAVYYLVGATGEVYRYSGSDPAKFRSYIQAPQYRADVMGGQLATALAVDAGNKPTVYVAIPGGGVRIFNEIDSGSIAYGEMLAGTAQTRGLTVDPNTGMVFFSALPRGVFQCNVSQLDQTTTRRVVAENEPLDGVGALALNGQKLYVGAKGRIGRVNLQNQQWELIVENLIPPNARKFAVELLGGSYYLFWIHQSKLSHIKFDANGTQAAVQYLLDFLVPPEVENAGAIAVHNSSDTLYFTKPLPQQISKLYVVQKATTNIGTPLEYNVATGVPTALCINHDLLFIATAEMPWQGIPRVHIERLKINTDSGAVFAEAKWNITWTDDAVISSMAYDERILYAVMAGPNGLTPSGEYKTGGLRVLSFYSDPTIDDISANYSFANVTTLVELSPNSSLISYAISMPPYIRVCNRTLSTRCNSMNDGVITCPIPIRSPDVVFNDGQNLIVVAAGSVMLFQNVNVDIQTSTRRVLPVRPKYVIEGWDDTLSLVVVNDNYLVWHSNVGTFAADGPFPSNTGPTRPHHVALLHPSMPALGVVPLLNVTPVGSPTSSSSSPASPSSPVTSSSPSNTMSSSSGGSSATSDTTPATQSSTQGSPSTVPSSSTSTLSTSTTTHSSADDHRSNILHNPLALGLIAAGGAVVLLAVVGISVFVALRQRRHSRKDTVVSLLQGKAGILHLIDSKNQHTLAKGTAPAVAPRLKDGAPTGMVTLVFTDVQGSTTLWELYPKEMKEAMRMHNKVMRQNIRKYHGYEVKTEGDAFMVAFASPLHALHFCLGVQDGLLRMAWPVEILDHPDAAIESDGRNTIFRGLRVRMGIHTGKPLCERDPTTGRMDYFGPVVNRAARVSATGTGGQIIISEGSYNIISKNQRACAAMETKYLGEFWLKGLETSERLWQVLPKRLAARKFPELIAGKTAVLAAPTNDEKEANSSTNTSTPQVMGSKTLSGSKTVSSTTTVGTGKPTTTSQTSSKQQQQQQITVSENFSDEESPMDV